MFPRALLPAGLFLLPLLALPTGALLPAQEGAQVPCGRADLVCPNLVVDPLKLQQNNIITRTFSATSCSVVEGMAPAGTHKLLRFTFTTPNLGPGDLVIGAPSQHPEWFVYSNCHNHYHFRQYADYRLWTPDGYAQFAALHAALPMLTSADILAMFPDLQAKMLTGSKAGFCVIDIVPLTHTGGLPLPPGLPAKYGSCGGNQGISVGWADEYFYSLDGQWVVIDTVAPGTYMLEAEVNAERLYHEVSYADNSVAVPVTL
jgi:lysyl oxidase